MLNVSQVGTPPPIETTTAVPGLSSLWAESYGDPRICIAILDGPVDRSHSCFSGANLTCLEALAPCGATVGPASAHGTHVASIIFGQHHSPVLGIAPGCRGITIPIFSDGPRETLITSSQLDLARAINQALIAGAHVINISGGQLAPGGEAEDHLARAVRLCDENGVLVVAAVGNEGCACLHIPAAVPAVLAVGAMDSKGVPLEFSNWGSVYRTQGILALGENILGALPGNGTARKTGTSFAAAVVSGAAALLLSAEVKHGRDPDPCAVRDVLLRSAIPCDVGEPAQRERFLAGRLNLTEARKLLKARRKTRSELNDSEVSNTALGLLATAFQPLPSVVRLAGIEDGLHTYKPNSTSEGGFNNVSDEKPEKSNGVSNSVSVSYAETTTTPIADSSSSNISPSATAAAATSVVAPLECGGTCGKFPLVYALGEIGYDFGTEARRDSLVQAGLANPYDPSQLIAFLASNPSNASAVIWTLNQETTAIYVVHPVGPFAANILERLREFLNGHLKEGVERVSIPGYVAGKVTLSNGQVVPTILPELRGLYSWSIPKLVQAVAGSRPTDEQKLAKYNEKTMDIENFLERVYYEIRNFGLTPQERAMNYAATNAFQLEIVFKRAIDAGMKLDSIGVDRSPICRQNSDCWDVKLTFFNPSKRLEQARVVYRFTVDVSDVVPVTVGRVRHWDIY